MRCDVGRYTADVIFNFTLTCRSPALTGNYYSDYQLFLYQTITEHREQGLTFDAIAEWMNKAGYLTMRGKRFRGAHVHSILRKRLAKEELLNREYPTMWSDFSMEVIDKTILMSGFGFYNEKKWHQELPFGMRTNIHIALNLRSKFLRYASTKMNKFINCEVWFHSIDGVAA